MDEVTSAHMRASALAAWSRLTRPWRGRRGGVAWYAAFAVYAGAIGAFSGPGRDRWWGIWSVGGYATAAAVAWCLPSRRGQLAALAVAVAGALFAPVVWLATQQPMTPDVTVVTRSASLLIHHGTPYLPAAALARGGVLAYNPYLPAMSIFGLPRALGLPGLAGDPRPWLAAATFLLLVAAFRIVTPGSSPAVAVRLAAIGIASPVLAFPIALGITDPPITAVAIVALALLTRSPLVDTAAITRRTWVAAILTGAASALKYTAWPVLAVLVVMTAARDGARAVGRFTIGALTAAVVLAVGLAPAALSAPAALAQNTIAFPLGLTTAKSPAQSPLPGHILATFGPTGHAAALVLLITSGLAVAAWLLIRPPATPAAATLRLAVGLVLMFSLSPDTRFGYLFYPIALVGWLVLTRPATPRAFHPDAADYARDGDRPEAALEASAVTDPHTTVKADVERLLTSPLLSPKVSVSGLAAWPPRSWSNARAAD
jgi:Glycosyltransferase family 87